MRIKWVGVAENDKQAIRAELRQHHTGSDFMVCSEKGRDQCARNGIRNSLWAFSPEFILQHSRLCRTDGKVQEALKLVQSKLCEDANEFVFGMITSFRKFWRHAVAADGYGHFLSPYDNKESEVTLTRSGERVHCYIYRMN